MHATPEDELPTDDLLELLGPANADTFERDSTTAYLNEIGLIPLLDAAAERELAERARAGDLGDASGSEHGGREYLGW